MPGALPRLTVGLPVYNGAGYLDATLKALRAQSFDDFELFVADNASTDATREIVESHRADDPRITLDIATENRGAAYNWNRCYARARTEYFTWACADDIPLSGKYSACIELLDTAGPAAALAYTGTELIDGSDDITGGYKDLGPLDDPTPAGRLQRIVRDLHLVHPLFGVIRTDVLKNTAGLGAYKRADTVLLGELAMRGDFLFDPSVHFQRRMHAEVSMQGSDTEIAALYTGRADAGPLLPNARVLRGHVAAIWRAPLTVGQRIQCLRTLRRWRYRRPFAKEMVRAPLTLPSRAVASVRRRGA